MLTAFAVVLVIADLWLLAICLRRRAILGAVCTLIASALLALSVAAGPGSEHRTAPLVGALVSLTVGTVPLYLGQALSRALEDPPEEPRP